MRVLITGINGFIGKHLAERLVEKGHKVSGIIREDGGVLNKKIVGKAIRNSEIVIHLAARTSHEDILDNKSESLEVSLQGTKNVLDAFSKSKTTKKFLYASTGKVYGRIVRLPISEEHATNPLNILGKSKLITERLIDFYSDSKKEFIIFRIFNIYGPGQNKNFLVPTILSQVNQGKIEIVLGDIKAKRDYVYIDDLVRAFILAIENKGSLGLTTYNICSGKSLNASQIVKIIEKIKGIDIKVKSNSNLVRRDEMRDEYGNFDKIKRHLGWKPTMSLTGGLRKLTNSPDRHNLSTI